MSVGQGLQEAALNLLPFLLLSLFPRAVHCSHHLCSSLLTWQEAPTQPFPFFLQPSLPQPTQKGKYQEKVQAAFQPWLPRP